MTRVKRFKIYYALGIGAALAENPDMITCYLRYVVDPLKR
jgi:hypothetical protein